MNPILFSRIFNYFSKRYSITLLKFHSAAHKFDSKVVHPGVTSILVERDHCDLPHIHQVFFLTSKLIKQFG